MDISFLSALFAPVRFAMLYADVRVEMWFVTMFVGDRGRRCVLGRRKGKRSLWCEIAKETRSNLFALQVLERHTSFDATVIRVCGARTALKRPGTQLVPVHATKTPALDYSSECMCMRWSPLTPFRELIEDLEALFRHPSTPMHQALSQGIPERLAMISPPMQHFSG